MGHIILPGQGSISEKPFAHFQRDPRAWHTLRRGIERAVSGSFIDNPMLVRTGAEERRRISICLKWIETMRVDHRYSVQRIVDELPRALRATLRGEPYAPPTRLLWAPEDQ